MKRIAAAEPSMFGILPAYGFFIRHAKGIEMNDIDISYMKEDRRPAFVLDVEGIVLENYKAQKANSVPWLVMTRRALARAIVRGRQTFRLTA